MVVTKSVTGLRSIGLYLFYVFKMSVLSITPCEQSLKELTAGKETEGQRQLLMFGSRNRRTKSRKLRTPSGKFLARPLVRVDSFWPRFSHLTENIMVTLSLSVTCQLRLTTPRRELTKMYSIKQ